MRAKATAAPDVYVADMPTDAQLTRIYDEYLTNVSAKTGNELAYYCLSMVGPRNRIDKLVKGLPLLT